MDTIPARPRALALAQPRRRRRLLLLLVYLVYLAVIIEGGSRLFFVAAGARYWEPENNVYFRHNFIRQHRHRGDFKFAFDRHHPTFGWATRPDLRDRTAFGDRLLNTNSRGLRGTREYPLEAPAATLRVVLLGDSFTFGEGVSDHETYAQRLEARFPRLEMINLGVHGYAHDQMLLFFEEEGLRYRPEVVMLGFIGADMKRNRLAFRDYAKPYFSLDAGKLRLRGVPIDAPEEFLRRAWLRPRALDLLEIVSLKIERRMGRLFEREKALTSALLDRIVERSRAIGAEPIFVFLPVGSEAYTDDPSPREDFFLDYCAAREISHLTLRQAFLTAADERFDFGRVFHWNEIGHDIAARALGEFMAERFPQRLQ